MDVKKVLYWKRSKDFFLRKNLKKISIVVSNVIGPEGTMIDKAEHPSNKYMHNEYR